MSGSWSFPPELWDYTLDFAHADAPALRAASSVCRSWRNSAQLHLFAALTVHNPARLAALLATSPRLAWFVRDLTIEALDGDMHPVDAFLATSPILPALRAFTADGWDFPAMHGVDPLLALLAPVRTLAVHRARFATLADVAGLLSATPRLRSLALGALCIDAPSEHAMPAPPFAACSVELTDGDAAPVLPLLLANPAAFDVRALALAPQYLHSPVLAPALAQLGPAVAQLAVHVAPQQPIDALVATLAACTAASTLEFTPAAEDCISWDPCAILPAVAAALYNAPAAAPLAGVTLRLGECCPHAVAHADWALLDFVATLPKFARVGAFRVVLDCGADVVRAGLRRLEAAGRLQVVIEEAC